MPLHVNLYHEVQRQERARQRDPLRLGMLAALICGIGLVAYYFVVLAQAHVVGAQFSVLQDEFAKLDPKAKAAKARQDVLNGQIQASNAMMKKVDGRFYWAPVLDEVLKAVPRSVQLTHLAADAPGDNNPLTVISVSGISSAKEPRNEAEALRISLESRFKKQFQNVSAVFKQLDDSDEIVLLNGQNLPTASFTIDIQIQTQDAAPAAPVPPRRARLASAQ